MGYNRVPPIIKLAAFVFLLLLSSLATHAQSANQVSGKVISEVDKESLPGVYVMVKATTIGTTTDAECEYQLNAPSKSDTLIFSFIGFKRQEIPIEGRSQINIEMAT